MSRVNIWVLAAGTALLASGASPTLAQQAPLPPQEAVESPDDYGYYRPVREKNATPTLAQQKAIARAQQRTERLESMRWYGFSGSRPTASGLPWTTMYSPAWQQPGGRPFAWYYASARPTVIYVQPTAPIYR